ncbi:MAG: two-component system, OmpR family, sensor kinase [Pseudonocardiales bacterium]|nr:two-component system, OmpR family, sensor kinase [Pseudonocardiales bacterium]
MSSVTVAEPDEVPARTRRVWLRSLTSRLVVGVVTLVVVLVALIGGTTYYSLKSFLIQRLDQQVTPIAQANAQHVFQCLQVSIPRCDINSGPGNFQPAQTEWLAVLDASGTAAIPVESGEALRPMSIGEKSSTQIVDDPTAVHTLTTTDGTTLRVGAAAVTVDGTTYYVVSGLSTAEVSKTLGRLLAIEIIIGAGAVVVALAATSWGVQRSLRNLYRVTGTAQDVAAELSPEGAGLDRRVPVVEEGTEVGRLAESVNTLLAAVETQFKARLENEQRMRQFLADASHELRTPLTSIRGYAELARMKRAATEQSAPTPGADDLDRIESEGTRMSRLVDDLLLLARGDADSEADLPHPLPVDLADVLDDAVTGSRAAHPDRPIEVDVADLPAVLGDRDQLLRVVRNLITNAAVHTAAGRPILVRGVPDAYGVTVTVADGGPGLPPEQAAHVFERFWRADKARTRARGGTGLGLSIVAAVVAAHGGSVRFDSSVETGSTVSVWLPAADE